MTTAATPLRALIVDDEGPARRILRRLLSEYCEGVHVVGEAEGVIEASAQLRCLRPDVVFLDIDLGRGSGFDAIEPGVAARTQVVFVTAYADHAVRAFRVSATDYLVKPIEIDLLRAAVQRVRSRMKVEREPSGPMITVQQAEGRRVIQAADIRHIQADGSYSEIILATGERVYVTRKLGALLEQLPASQFARVHRSHGVNLRRVRSVSATHATLDDGSAVPIRRGSAKEVLEAVAGVGEERNE